VPPPILGGVRMNTDEIVKLIDEIRYDNSEKMRELTEACRLFELPHLASKIELRSAVMFEQLASVAYQVHHLDDNAENAG